MFQTDFTVEELAGRRAALCNQIGNATALLIGAPAVGGYARFEQYNDFYYLCGVEVPQAYLTIDGATGRTTLFLPGSEFVPSDDDYPLPAVDNADYVLHTTGVDAVKDRSELWKSLARTREIYLPFLDGEGHMSTFRSINARRRLIDADPVDGRESRADFFRSKVTRHCPDATQHDIGPIIYEMRMHKSPREIELLRRAGELTARGLCDAMKATKPGVMEYQLAAILQYHYIAGGAGDCGYPPIVGGGVNAFHPHYSINNCPLQDGDLVLVDCGPYYHQYTSDITRMWPVNGTYTPAQRALYGFVTEYHKTLLGAIRPGRMCTDIEAEAIDIMRSRLPEFDFATPSHATGPEWMFDFAAHQAHSVGMSVHDGLSHKERPLEPGIVYTVDPQMRIESDRLYLRVEDTIVITEDGCDVLTKDVPLELDEIESMMRGENILELFPPIPE